MEIVALNERIVFQEVSVSEDDIGNRKNVWVDCCSRFATISGESGKESTVIGVTTEVENICFTIRYCQAGLEMKSKTHRILFRGEVYNILYVEHLNYKKKALKFHCEKVRG